MIYELLVVTALALCCNAVPPTENYDLNLEFKNGNVKLYWNYTSTDITFEVHGKTLGWVGIGFSPNGAMTGADIIAGWVKNGQVFITDRHGVSNSFPPKDPVQNIEILGGFESEGWTVLKFSRQLASCEAKYDREITQGTERLIWALGTSDPDGDDIADYHGMNRGVESTYVLEPLDKPSDQLPVGPVYKTFDIKTEKLSVPPQKTYYNCRIVEMPQLTEKHHIVKFEPLIQEGNELIVHHMVVSECKGFKNAATFAGKDSICFDGWRRTYPSCISMFAAWAVGGGPFILPPEAGYPIGEPGSSKYLMIETHYDNPTMASNYVDSSGIRVTYTNALRKFDSGMLEIGTMADGRVHFIPPGAESFTTSGVCAGNCLEKWMNASDVSDIKIFSSFLHTHLAGRSMKLRHYRDGVELPFIDYDLTYDFNYQESRHITPSLVILPNDILRIDCTYNTIGKTQMTEGGEGTEQEMCLAFLSYYPRIDLSVCLTAPLTKESWHYLGIYNVSGAGVSLNGYNVTSPAKFKGQTLMQAMSSFDWTQANIAKFEKAYMEMSQRQYCIPGNVSQFSFALVHNPITASDYELPTRECLRQVTTTQEDPQTTTSRSSSWHKGSLLFIVSLLPLIYLR